MANVYISFSMRDLGIVREAAYGLERTGYRVWIFYDQLSMGSPVFDGGVPEPYRRAIQNCDVFILFVSNYSIRSRNVTEELRYAVSLEKPIIPVRLDWYYDDPQVTELLRVFDPADFTTSFYARMDSLITRIEHYSARLERKADWPRLLALLPIKEVPVPGEPPEMESGSSQESTPTPTSEALKPIVITDENRKGTAKKTMAKDAELPKSKPKPKPKPEPKAKPKLTAKSKPKSTLKSKKKRGEADGVGFEMLGDPGKESARGSGRERPEYMLPKAEVGRQKGRDGGKGGRHLTHAKPPKPTLPMPQARYANVVLLEGSGPATLDAAKPIKRLAHFRLRLDIGKLSQLSAVVDAVPFPSHRLPPDIWLDVMVSSTDFEVGRTRRALGLSTVAEGRFFLPGDGSAAKAEGKGRFLYIHLRAPKSNKLARARITYYYRNHPVQSQLLLANIGGKASRFKVITDYTLSEDLTGLERLPRRRQLSILTNDNNDSNHQFIIRAAKSNDSLIGTPLTFEVNSIAIGSVVRRLRDTLYKHSPSKRARRVDQLKDDLKALAPLGWDLFNEAGMSRYLSTLYPLLMKKGTGLVVQVARPSSSRFVFPWGFIYDIPLYSDREPQFCSIVENWDDRSPLFTDTPHQCPTGKHAPNTLCPFGFWGFRHSIEQLSRTDKPPTPIAAPADFTMVMAETQYEVDCDLLKVHAKDLAGILKRTFPGAHLDEGLDLASIKALLGQDTPLVYFYCHGERPKYGSSDTILGVGNREILSSKDFNGWVTEWYDYGEGRLIWDKVRPLIFINACHSIDINPDSLVTYLDAFIGTGHASGVIGTEVRVDQTLAMEAAKEFFESFLGGASIGEALHKMQADFLRSGNLFGLAYTPYCWSDLTLEKM